jgi:hypothetical protein
MFEVKISNKHEVQMIIAKDVDHLVSRLTEPTEYLIMKSYELSKDWEGKHFVTIK